MSDNVSNTDPIAATPAKPKDNGSPGPSSASQGADPSGKTPGARQLWPSTKARRRILAVAHYTILALSLGLIVYLSYCTFTKIPFLQDASYMGFQLIVCIVFIADFFIELWLTQKGHRGGYWKRRWAFLVLSLPVLNVVDFLGIHLSADLTYFVRFLPLARGVLAMVIVFNYMLPDRINSLFANYVAILFMAIYFGGLIFFEREVVVNPDVTSYWDAFYWSAAQATTLNCPIIPYTLAGKILEVIISGTGIIMFPLFTVFMTNLIKRERIRLKLINIREASVKSSPQLSTQAASQPAKVVNSAEKP